MKVTPVEGIWWLRHCETCSGFSEEISIGAAHSTGWQKEAAVQPCEVNPCRAGLLTTRPHSNHRPSVCQIFSDCTFTHWESPPRQTRIHGHSSFSSSSRQTSPQHRCLAVINTRAHNSSVSQQHPCLFSHGCRVNEHAWAMRISAILRVDRTGCLFDASWLPPELLCEYTLYLLSHFVKTMMTRWLIYLQKLLWRAKVRLSNIRSPSCHIALKELHLIIKQEQTITISQYQHDCDSDIAFILFSSIKKSINFD